MSAPDGFTWETPAEDLDERCGACGGMLRYAVCVDCGTRHFGVEYRNVGEHEWPEQGIRCVHGCTWAYTGEGEYVLPACPSVQERRLVGPWEPTPSDHQPAPELGEGLRSGEPVRDEEGKAQ